MKKILTETIDGKFGRIDANGNIFVLESDGSPATRLEVDGIYTVNSDGSKSTRYEHPNGIVISRPDAEKIGLEIEY